MILFLLGIVVLLIWIPFLWSIASQNLKYHFKMYRN